MSKLARLSGENWTVQPISAEPGQVLESAMAPDGQSVANAWNGP